MPSARTSSTPKPNTGKALAFEKTSQKPISNGSSQNRSKTVLKLKNEVVSNAGLEECSLTQSYYSDEEEESQKSNLFDSESPQMSQSVGQQAIEM